MIQLGIIGTNWISHQFVKGAIQTGSYELTGVYSRKLESAQRFSEKYSSAVFLSDNLEEFLSSDKIGTVYIASPNSLHFEQAKSAINQGKNVIVEKPAFSNPKELSAILSLAKEKNVYFFEAARNVHEANFKLVKEFIDSSAKIQGASFTYMKYSSRYDEVIKGSEPNIFSLNFSGGALMDLGVYLVYAAIGWFGKPEKAEYFATKISTGVDGSGVGVLRYNEFDVMIHTGKTGDSFARSEIYFEDGTLVLDSVNSIKEAIEYDRHDQSEAFLALEEENANPLYQEAVEFARIIQSDSDSEIVRIYESYVKLAKEVNQVIYEMRQSAGIIFTAD